MGVTVHFEGRLKSARALSSLLLRVEAIGREEFLLTERFENPQARLSRVLDEKPCDYVGPTSGIVLYLHEDCEPLRFEFDRDLYVQEWVKTQFAGVDTHIRLIEILRDIEKFFQILSVHDEAEYWESENRGVLTEHIRRCDEVIVEFAVKNPRAQIKVKERNGRLIDLIE